jgi:hypothetical protein
MMICHAHRVGLRALKKSSVEIHNDRMVRKMGGRRKSGTGRADNFREAYKFSTGFSSGEYGGRLTSVMFDGQTKSFARW